MNYPVLPSYQTMVSTRPVITPKQKHAPMILFASNKVSSHLSSERRAPIDNQRLSPLQLKLRAVKDFLSGISFNRGLKAFFSPELPPVPRLLMSDAYNIGSGPYISDTQWDASNYHIYLARRRAPWMDKYTDKNDNRIQLFGLQMIIMDLLSKPITRKEIDETERFLKKQYVGGTTYRFDRKMWDRVVDECHGIIPIKIEAIPEGSVGYVGEPLIQVKAKDGFGELAAWFEQMLLQVFATSEMSTRSRYLLDYNKQMVRRCTNENLSEEEVNRRAALRIHDFSLRSCSCPQEAERLSIAHLTSHLTTSTFQAVYAAKHYFGDNPVGQWLASLAHRLVEGHTEEGNAYKALANAYPDRITSHVDDCYDPYRAVHEYLIPLAKDAKAASQGGVIVARPDSGDLVKQVVHALTEAVNTGLYKVITGSDGKPLIAMTQLKTILADGMNIDKIREVDSLLLELGFSPVDSVSYGIGGGLIRDIERDYWSTKMALSQVGSGNETRNAAKFSVGKHSIPGEIKIVREVGHPSVRLKNELGKNEMVTFYDGTNGKIDIRQESFETIRNRSLNHWDNAKAFQPTELLSNGIQAEIEALRQKHVENGEPFSLDEIIGRVPQLDPVKQGILNAERIQQILRRGPVQNH